MKITMPFNFPTSYVLKIAKYTPHKKGNGFIRQTNNGRFHIIKENKNEWNLHFDIFLDTGHWSPYMPFTCGKEKARILGIIKNIGGDIIPKYTWKKKEKVTMNDKHVELYRPEWEERKKLKKLSKARKEQRRKAKNKDLEKKKKEILYSGLSSTEIKEALKLLPVDN